MQQRSAHDTRHGRLALALILGLLAVLAALAASAQVASAYSTFVHGGITTCATCHIDGHTRWTPVSEVCNTCHPGYRRPTTADECWTCHTPGQDTSGMRNDASCTTACHLPGGDVVTHAAHADLPAACTTCHPLTASITDAAGSPHHLGPPPAAPAITSFWPASGSAGTTVILRGTTLSGATDISFGGTPAPEFVVITSTRITATVPWGAASGPIVVNAPGGTAVSAADFVVTGRLAVALELAVKPKSTARGSGVTASGSLKPASLGSSAVRLTLQLRTGSRWRIVRRAVATSTAAGTFRWTCRPAKAGAYRLRASLRATNAHWAATSEWAAFRVT